MYIWFVNEGGFNFNGNNVAIVFVKLECQEKVRMTSSTHNVGHMRTEDEI